MPSLSTFLGSNTSAAFTVAPALLEFAIWLLANLACFTFSSLGHGLSPSILNVGHHGPLLQQDPMTLSRRQALDRRSDQNQVLEFGGLVPSEMLNSLLTFTRDAADQVTTLSVDRVFCLCLYRPDLRVYALL